MIEINNITKGFGKKKPDVLKELTFKVEESEIFGFLGHNGAGKTTLINLICGILPLDKGNITLNGRTLKENSIEYKKSFGFVPDSPSLFPKMTAFDYLKFVSSIYEVPEDVLEAKIDFFDGLFGIKEFLNELLGSLSHGMTQKITITAALLHDPEILILDEPLVGLDPKSAFNLKELLLNLKSQGKTIFFSSHIVEIVEKLCDKIAIIKKGELQYIGTIENTKNQFNENLESIMLRLG